MAEAPADPLVGKVLNQVFTVLAPLGVGGMGRVYKALQSPLERVVALKVLNPRYAENKDPGFERRFFLEAAMTAKLKHPNTITVHDYGRTDDGIFFIAMEYLEGITLQQLLHESGPLPWPRALRIGAQICRSLREAHKLGIVHRDLKPANVMVLREETDHDMVKVLDFGLVKAFQDTHAANAPDVELTQQGVLLGSPLYMAPEQARNEADPRSDVYAWGVLMYQCIGGSPPFTGKESIDIIVKHIREKPAPLLNLVPDLPAQVNALVMRCLEKEPAKRYQSMDELLEVLRELGSSEGISGVFSDPRTGLGRAPSGVFPAAATPLTSTQAGDELAVPWEDVSLPKAETVSPPARGRWSLLLVAGAVVFAVGATLAYALHSRTPPRPAVVELPVPVEPPPRPKPSLTPVPATAETTFHVSSVPPGAQVSSQGHVLGVTPFSFTVAGPEGERASAQLSFTLDGYTPVEMTASGQGSVEVSQALSKKPQVKIKPKGGQDGYKDDPYQ